MARFTRGYSPAHALLWALMNLSGLLPALLARWFFDDVTGAASPPVGAYGVVVLLAALALGQSALWMIAGHIEIVFRFLASALLRRNLLGLLLDRPGALPLPYGIGETLSRFRDDVDVAEDSLDWSDEIVGQALVALFAFGVLLSVDVQLTLTVVLPLVVVIGVARRFGTALECYRSASSHAASAVAGALGDALTAVETIRAAGAEERVVAHLHRLNTRRQALVVKDRLATQILEAVTVNLSGVGTALVMLLAASGVQGGRLTVGDFVLFVAYLAIITGFVSELGQYLAQFRQTAVAFDRMRALAGDAPPGSLTAPVVLHLYGPLPDARTGGDRWAEPLEMLDVSGLTYRHPGADRGIEDVDLQLPQGSLTVVTGRVGSGKTTLLRTLLGLLPQEAGEIRWNGMRINDPAEFFVPPRAAYTPQAPRLFSETLRGNIL